MADFDAEWDWVEPGGHDGHSKALFVKNKTELDGWNRKGISSLEGFKISIYFAYFSIIIFKL